MATITTQKTEVCHLSIVVPLKILDITTVGKTTSMSIFWQKLITDMGDCRSLFFKRTKSPTCSK
jgi:hypothetical protein